MLRPTLALRALAAATSLALAACAAQPAVDAPTLREQVRAAERAFAQTMADRDAAAFAGFVADDAVFLAGARVLHGRTEVAAAWQRYFETPAAPFSWSPEQVELADSGRLAWSTGPVLDADGRLVAHFNSVWRRDADGRWRVIFDKGSEVCSPRRG